MDPNLLIGGVIGALIGAGVAIWRSRYSARSADLTKRVETINSIIDALADSASRARTHLGADKDGLISSKSYCIALQGRLDDAIERLDSDFADFSNADLNAAYIEFARFSTGGSFDEPEHEPESTIRGILISGGRLKDEVAKARMKHY